MQNICNITSHNNLLINPLTQTIMQHNNKSNILFTDPSFNTPLIRKHIHESSTQALLLALAIANLHTGNNNKPNQDLLNDLAQDWDKHTLHHFYTNSDDQVFKQSSIEDLKDIYDPELFDLPSSPDIQDEAAFTEYLTFILDKYYYIGTYFRTLDPKTNKTHTVIITLDI